MFLVMEIDIVCSICLVNAIAVINIRYNVYILRKCMSVYSTDIIIIMIRSEWIEHIILKMQYIYLAYSNCIQLLNSSKRCRVHVIILCLSTSEIVKDGRTFGRQYAVHKATLLYTMVRENINVYIYIYI